MSGAINVVAAFVPSGPLSAVPRAQLQAWLNEALQARHQLTVGTKPTVVLYSAGEGSRSVTFARASLPNLNAYINELMQALGTGHGRSRGIRVNF